MEEKVKVSYEGKVLEAERSQNGSYTIKLPKSGSLIRRITKDEDGEWMFMESDLKHTDSYFWLKLKQDGTMEYANDFMNRSQTSDGAYNPAYSNMGTLDKPARNLYFVAKQLEGYEKLGVSPIEVLDLRYKMMGMALKMLGYQSVSQVLSGEPNPDTSIVDLNRAVEFLDQYPAFAQYVTKADYSSVPTVDVNVPEDFDKEAFKEQFAAAKKAYEDEKSFYAVRMDTFSRVRHPIIQPDFCLGMKDKVNSDDWNFYSETIKKLGKLVLSFNADLLSPGDKMRIVQGTSLSQLDLTHQVSLITQVEDMDEALAIESYFFIDEASKFDQKVRNEMLDERTRTSTPGKLIKQMGDEINAEVDEREKAIKSRDYYRHYYPYDKNRRKVESGPKEDDEHDFID